MSREHAKEGIKKLVDEFLNLPKSELDSMKEEQVKWKFIEPLLALLGWGRNDIEKESSVLRGRADYLLRLGHKEALVIEAKKPSVRLTELEGQQAVSYAYHRKIKFTVLTNFKQIRFYHALSNIKNIDKNLLKDSKGLLWIDCENYEKEFDRLWYLSKECFENGEINKLLSLKDEKINRPIDEKILEDLLKIRDILSKDLKSKRMELSDSQIDEIVQIFIDRLIFMRSVEDRELETKNFLLKIMDDVHKGITEKTLWVLIKEQFARFDSVYNSKLFQTGILEKFAFFSDDALKKVIKILYYGIDSTQEKYMFDEIPGDLFGNIYEQYLGTILAGTDKRVKLDSESGKRKKMGIYYTPSYITDYIVKNTVGEYIKNKSIDEILDVNIVDPACGSGSFLIRAFKEVCDIVEEKLKNGERSKKWNTFSDYNNKLNFSQKSTILKNCIYGVDLDEKAVELAQLNLLLKCLEREDRSLKNRKLPNLLSNIKNGNSLIDDIKVAGDKAFNWHAQFKEVFDNGGFDVVVGNPPWSSKIVTSEVNTFLSDKYKLPQKNMNIFGVFVIHSLNLLRNEGLFALLIPKVIIKNDSYSQIRKRILDNYSLSEIMDFGQFPGVASDAVCLKIENKKGFQPIKIRFFEESKLIRENTIIENIFLKSQSYVFSLSTDSKIQNILDKIVLDNKKLNELFKIKRGIELGQKSAIVKCKKCGNYNEANTKYYGKSEKVCKSCGSKLSLEDKIIISSDDKEKDYSMMAIAGNQLKKYNIISNYFIIPNLIGIDYKNEAFKGPKILIKRINSKIEGTFEDSGLYAFNTVYSLYGNEKKNSYLWTVAILNSKLINFFYEYSYNVGMNLTTQVTIDFLSQIPIRLPTPSQEKIIVDLVNQMLELQKKYHDEKVVGGEKERLKQQIDNVDYEIDQEVYKLYDLTPEEIKIIEENLK